MSFHLPQFLKRFSKKRWGKQAEIADLEENLRQCDIQRRDLMRERDQLTRALNASMAGIVVLNTDYTVRFLNQTWLEIFELSSPQRLLGKTFQVFFTEQQFQTHFLPLAQRARKEGGATAEIKCMRLDNSVLTLWARLNLILDDNEECTGYVLAGRDISDQKLQAEELNRRAQELEIMNRAMVGREVKMAELKQRLEKLESDGRVLRENVLNDDIQFNFFIG